VTKPKNKQNAQISKSEIVDKVLEDLRSQPKPTDIILENDDFIRFVNGDVICLNRAAREKAEKMLADHKTPWEINQNIPELKIETWRIYKDWCAEVGIDPDSCANRKLIDPGYHTLKRQFESSPCVPSTQRKKNERLLELIDKGELYSEMIRCYRFDPLWMPFADRVIILQIKPIRNWPGYFYRPSWEIKWVLLEHYPQAREILFQAADKHGFVRHDAGAPGGQGQPAKPERTDLDEIIKGWKSIGGALHVSPKTARRRAYEAGVIHPRYEGKSPIMTRREINKYLESLK
jgi:hypothetical protein